TGDRHIASLSFLRCTRRQHLRGDRFQSLTLFGSRFLVDVIICKIPVSERLHHSLTLWALPDAGDRKSVEFHFSVIAFLNEEHLAAAAGHLGRFGAEPTWARGVARTRFLELAGNFPWSFVFSFICCSSKGRSKEEEPCNEGAGEEKYGFHGAKFYDQRRLGQADFVVRTCCNRYRVEDTDASLFYISARRSR